MKSPSTATHPPVSGDPLRSAGLLRLFQLARELPDAQTTQLRDGELLIREGEPSDRVYLIMSGEAEVCRNGQVVGRKSAGDCVGELGVIEAIPRTASVRAVGHVELLDLPGERFLELHASSPKLRDALGRMRLWYDIPGGFLRQYSSTRRGESCIDTVYSLAGGRTLVASRWPNRPGYGVELIASDGGGSGELHLIRHRDPDGSSCLELWGRLDADGALSIARISAHRDLPGAYRLLRKAFDDVPLTAADQVSLVDCGELPKGAQITPSPLLCRCVGVEEASVRHVILAGRRTLEQVQEETGCATVCGACRCRVLALLEETMGATKALREPTPPDEVSRPLLSPADLSIAPRSGLVLLLERLRGIGMLHLPLLVLTATALLVTMGVAGAPGTTPVAVLVAALVALDLGISWTRWRRIFRGELPAHPTVSEPLAAAANGRPPSVPIEGLVMQRLPLRDWLVYTYSLRLDYLLNDLWRGSAYLVRKLALRLGVRRARRWEAHYQPHWEDCTRQLGELVLETSLCTGLVSSYTDERTGALVGVFRCDDWVCPAGPHVAQEAVQVETLEFHVDLAARRATSCRLNGHAIGPGADALVLAFHAVTVYLHPVLHAYANWACLPGHPDKALARAAIYTLGLNGVAWEPAYLSTRNPRTLRRLLEHNAGLGIRRHGTGSLFRLLAQHSRFAAFTLRARTATMEVLRDRQVEVDPEAFFLMGVLHSVEHYCCALAVDPLSLRSELLRDRTAEVVRSLFVAPLRPVFANMRLSRQDAPWLVDLRIRLHAIDPELAEQVDCSIMY